MNKQDFLERFRAALFGLPQEDIEERVAFYSEMLDDLIEDGATEEEAVEQIGPVEDIVSQILEETPLPRLVRERMRPKRRMQTWEIVLLILGFPLWFPLLAAVFAVVLSLYLVLWCLVIVLWAVEGSFVGTAFGCVVAGIVSITRAQAVPGLAMIAGGLILAGLSIFLFFACGAATRGIGRLSKRLVLWMKSLFLRKEAET